MEFEMYALVMLRKKKIAFIVIKLYMNTITIVNCNFVQSLQWRILREMMAMQRCLT